MPAQEPRRSAPAIRQVNPVGDDPACAGLFSRSALLLRALSTTTPNAHAPGVEPIEIHLSMPDGVLLPIDDLALIVRSRDRIPTEELRRHVEAQLDAARAFYARIAREGKD